MYIRIYASPFGSVWCMFWYIWLYISKWIIYTIYIRTIVHIFIFVITTFRPLCPLVLSGVYGFWYATGNSKLSPLFNLGHRLFSFHCSYLEISSSFYFLVLLSYCSPGSHWVQVRHEWMLCMHMYAYVHNIHVYIFVDICTHK